MSTNAAVIPGRADRLLLLGVARSGTRWLATTLGHTERSRLVKEPDKVDADRAGSGHSRLGFGAYPVLDRGDPAPHYRALWDLAFSARVPNRAGWKRSAARVALHLPRRVRDPLLRRTAQAISSLPGRPAHVVVKSIYAQFAAEWLVDVYQPRVIVIQRDPLNVISSWAELGVHGFDLLERPSIRERHLERLGIAPLRPGASQLQSISTCVGLLCTMLGEHLDRHPEWLLVTHEELCIDPERAIRAVADWAGLTWTEETARFLNESNRAGTGFSHERVTRDQPDRWRARLNDAQVAEIEAVLAQFPSHGWVRPPDRRPASEPSLSLT